MKGYIYTMFGGADPGTGWVMTDPLLSKRPTLGACMPNIRRLVVPGDHIFFVSGRVDGFKQYVVGGFEVDEKIDALAAYRQFPENRMREVNGQLRGNIVVREDGSQNPIDYHTNFSQRVKNYVVGTNPQFVEGQEAVAKARELTIPTLSKVFAKNGDTVSSILGRWRKLDPAQIDKLYRYIESTNRG